MGTSTQGREDALAHAKRNLLTKLGNSIHVEAESFSRLVSVDGQQSAEYRDVQRVLEKVDFAPFRSDRDRGRSPTPGQRNLCGRVPAAGPQPLPGWKSDLDTEVKRFDAWDKTAQEAQSRAAIGPPSWRRWSTCQRPWPRSRPRWCRSAPWLAAPARVEQRLTSRWLALVEASTKLRAQVRFVLDVQTGERMSPVAADLTEFFRLALAPLGSEVRLAPTCPAGRHGHLSDHACAPMRSAAAAASVPPAGRCSK